MRYKDPLKLILSQTISHWDRDETRPAVRWAFGKALRCRTEAFGGEVYGSENEERIFYHPCKSRPCSSCGYRASEQWRRERRAALPDVVYKGITFTMPKVLWGLFRDNRGLTNALAALAAGVMQARVKAKHGLDIGVIAILHTFNGKLEFNSHVHTMITAGGLCGDTWVSSVYHDQDRLMKGWQKAVIELLRAALRAGPLNTNVSVDEMEALLNKEEKSWWSVKIQSFESKEPFLGYAGRYVRRPPIAQYRISYIGERTIKFRYKDKKEHRPMPVECSLEEFVDRWAEHILERYQHSVRNFGSFSPRGLAKTAAAMFAILRQKRMPPPKTRRWAHSLMQDFGRDPLLDRAGNRMKWVRRVAPRARQPIRI